MALTEFLTTDRALASVFNDKVVTPANAHISATENPHSVTKTQVGLSNVTNDEQIPKSLIDAAGDLIIGTAGNTPGRLAKGTARQQLAMNPGATAPEWVASLQSLMTASGDIVYASNANTPAKLAKGIDGQFLALASGFPSWVTGSVVAKGSYSGNGVEGRNITTGFATDFVFLWATTPKFWIATNTAGYTIMLQIGANAAAYSVKTSGADGFFVGSDATNANASGTTYGYVAVKI